jgi:hypothetical protein
MGKCVALLHVFRCVASHALPCTARISCVSHLIVLRLLDSSLDSSSVFVFVDRVQILRTLPFPLHFSAIAIYQDVVAIVTEAAVNVGPPAATTLSLIIVSHRWDATSLCVVILMTPYCLLSSPRRLQLLPSPPLIPSTSTVSVSRIIRPSLSCCCVSGAVSSQ